MFYAYYLDEINNGIVNSWQECLKYVHKVKGVKYKKFETKEEALQFIQNKGLYEKKNTTVKKISKETIIRKDAIYFDAGTGRNGFVEVNVTEYNKKSIIDKVIDKKKISKYSTYILEKGKTNNYGELLGLYIALKYSLENNIKYIYGDSKLVIDYWANKRYSESLNSETKKLIFLVCNLKEEYLKKGGLISYISGDYNPADLGFHK